MRRQRDLGILGPSNLFVAFWFLGVVLPIVPFLNEADGFSLMWPFSFDDKSSSLIFALFVYVVVLFSFLFGYTVVARLYRPKNRSASRETTRGFSFAYRATAVSLVGILSVILLIYLVGGVGNWLQAGSDRIREFAGLNFVVLLQNGMLSVSLGWFIKITDGGGSFRLLNNRMFLIFSLSVLLVVAVQGAKSTLFVYLFAMLVIWHAKVRVLPLWRLGFVGVILYVLLMIYHLLKQEYLAVGYFVFYDPDDGWLLSFIRFMSQQLTGNLMQLQTMTVLVDAVPKDLDFQYGSTLKMIFLIWVPSFLFPDKPLTAPGVFTMAFWPEKWITEGTTMPPGLFGELFMNFGIFGSMVGAAVFGAIYGFVYARAMRGSRQFDLGLYAIMAGLLLHYFRGELASVTVLLLSMIIPLMWILKGQYKTERVSSQ